MAQVLLIDDSKLAGIVIQKILDSKGISFTHTQSVAQVFGFRGEPSRLREWNPQVILLDILMPEMDGLDVLAKLKARNDTKNIPVIMTSSSASERNVMEALQRGAAGFLSKPLNGEKLVEELVRIADLNGLHELGGKLSGHRISGESEEEDDDSLYAGPANLNYLLDLLDGDREMLKEMIQVFIDDMPSHIARISQSIQEANCDGLRRNAHAYKGSLSNFGAPDVTDLAFMLECAGKDQDLSKVSAIFDDLANQSEVMHDALERWMDNAE